MKNHAGISKTSVGVEGHVRIQVKFRIGKGLAKRREDVCKEPTEAAIGRGRMDESQRPSPSVGAAEQRRFDPLRDDHEFLGGGAIQPATDVSEELADDN